MLNKDKLEPPGGSAEEEDIMDAHISTDLTYSSLIDRLPSYASIPSLTKGDGQSATVNKFAHFAIGKTDFAEIIEEQTYYVDKTLFIQEIIDNPGEVSLITRPRRFGKTLTMSMLQCFFSPTVNGKKTRDLFNHLQIAQVEDGRYLKQYQGQFPVIFITFKDIKEKKFEDAIDSLKGLISELYSEHASAITSSALNDKIEYEQFQNYRRKKINFTELKNALKFLSKCLYKVYGNKKVMVLIDEYDTPMLNACHHGYWKEMSDFMSGFFSQGLKGNANIHKAIIAGILRIKKENIFSGLNHVEVYTVCSERYAQYFGFTEDEMKKILQDFNMTKDVESFKKWYGGYVFGDSELFNPWSVVRCVNGRKESSKFKNYWTETAENTLIEETVERYKSNDTFRSQIKSLLLDDSQQNRSIEIDIKGELTYADIKSDHISPSEAIIKFWSLCLHCGYLTMDLTRAKTLIFPNLETISLFKDEIKVIEKMKMSFAAGEEQKIGGKGLSLDAAQTLVGFAQQAVGNPLRQKELFETALPILILHYGEQHLEVAKIKVRLAALYWLLCLAGHDRQNYFYDPQLLSFSRALFEYGLPILTKHSGEQDKLVITASLSLADLYFFSRDDLKCQKLLERVLPVLKSTFGKQHAELVRVQLNLATVTERLNDIAKASSLLDECEILLPNLSGNTKRQYLSDYKMIRKRIVDKQAIPAPRRNAGIKTEDSFKSLAPGLKKAFAQPAEAIPAMTCQDKRQADDFFQRALKHYKEKEYDQAIPLFSGIITFYKTIPEYNEDELAKSLFTVGSCYQALGKYPEAKFAFSEAYQVYIKLHGESHKQTQACKMKCEEIEKINRETTDIATPIRNIITRMGADHEHSLGPK